MKRKCPAIDIARTGKNIKLIMKLKGYSVKDIQEYLELGTPQSIYHWFEGRNLPTIDNLYALGELFHMPVDALLMGNRKPKYKCWNKMHRRLLIYYERLNSCKTG